MSDREQSPTGENEAAVVAEHLNVKVTNGNDEVFFKIKRTTRLERLMKAFCERSGKSFEASRFTFDGEKVQPGQTPNDLDMDDGDALEVFQQQIGGGGFCL